MNSLFIYLFQRKDLKLKTFHNLTPAPHGRKKKKSRQTFRRLKVCYNHSGWSKKETSRICKKSKEIYYGERENN